MTRSSNQLPSRVRRKQSKYRKRLLPLAERLGARWLEFCAKRITRRIVGVSKRDTASLAGHWRYGALKRVEYFDVKLAPDGVYREGPLAHGVQMEGRLRKAILTYNTCINVCEGFWQYLQGELRGRVI